MAGKLYIVATPIGNLEDLSPRALRILTESDFIAAEDTRVTLKLLNRFSISKPMISYYEHNTRSRGEEIVARILRGETCALCSDAGTPAISDPGEKLVMDCAENGIEVISIPGPSAVISALSVSGLPTGRFTFEGFLSTSRKSRREHLNSLVTERRTMVFYEAPHKLIKTLRDMGEAFGNRRITICRELTKLHEQTLRTTLENAAEYFTENAPRGEFVLIVEGAQEEERQSAPEDAEQMVKELMDGGLSFSESVKEAAKVTGISKNLLYQKCRDIAGG